MSKDIDLIKASEILTWFRAGKSQREIAKITGITRSTVGYILRRYKKTGTLKRLPCSGRPRLLKDPEISVIHREVIADPRISGSKLAASLVRKTGVSVSKQTMINCLNSLQLKSRTACRKPLLSEKNKKARLDLATQWFFWPKERWNSVIFSDECKFNLFGSDGRTKVWRKDGTRYATKNLIPTVKHGGGSVMVWGCVSAAGVGKLVFIDGIMDKFAYCRILADNLRCSAELLGLEDFIFQQDNDPKHTSKLLKDFFTQNNINLLPWPAQSPDLNPIEHVWAHMKKEVAKYNPKNKQELKERLQQVWDAIDPEFLQRLVSSMCNRTKAVIEAKGMHTRY